MKLMSGHQPFSYQMVIKVLTFLLLQWYGISYPSNATKQPDVHPKGRAASVYCFDPGIYDENYWMKLKSTLI
jgi:hypothetical protein